MIELFFKGGPLMYPLLLCSLISLAVIIEKGLHYLAAKTNRNQIESILQAARGGDFTLADKAARESRSPIARVLGVAIAHRKLPRIDLENRISRVGSIELKRLGSRLHLLELIGKIAPMLGLTGTVTGLTRAFRAVAALKQVSDPGVLASGIWEALITTVAGLFIGIPTLILFHLYENRLKSLAFDMKSYGEELLSELGERG